MFGYRALPAIFLLLAPTLLFAQDSPPYLSPIPAWAEQGRFTFMRMDGGYLEQEKARRSDWGQTFSPAESQALGDLYAKNADQMIGLMKQANVTWVWVTWSNGWSHQYEAKQWQDLRPVIAALHKADIRVMAYLCTTTIFWENMFLDQSRSVTWLSFVPRDEPWVNGRDLARPPYPYTPEWRPRIYVGTNPRRFVADVANPEWRDYVKFRVSAALDAGVDAFFFDNPFVGFAGTREVESFMADIQHFIKKVKNSPALFSTNVGMSPRVLPVNDQCEVLVNEFGVEPGVYDGHWDTANIRKVRYLKGACGTKPHMYQTGTGTYRSGRREVAFMTPKSQKLAIAEAAALQSNFTNLLEGRFLGGLLHGDREALESWKAIGDYNRFLLAHQDFYANAQPVPELLVVASDQWPIPFDWGQENGQVFDLLARESIQYDVLLLSRLSARDLAKYPTVLLPGIDSLPGPSLTLLQKYQREGGKIYAIGGAPAGRELADVQSSTKVLLGAGQDPEANREIKEKLGLLLGRRTVELGDSGNVLALLSRIGGTNRLVIHFLNYGDSVQRDVPVKLDLSFLDGSFNSASFKTHSPDTGGQDIRLVKADGKRLQLVLPAIETYLVTTVNF